MLTLKIMAFIWGACFGSFLNVVIYRLPHGMSLSHPGSHCCSCDAPIRWYDNIPVLSYLILRGKCRRCKAPYSPRYMLIEAACGALSLALFQHYVQWPGEFVENPAFLGSLALWLYFLMFSLALVAAAFIDLAHFFLPDEITLPGIALGIFGAYLLPGCRGLDHLIAAAAGALLLGLVALFGRLIYRREAMGQGDLKLLSMIGAFLGWRALPFVLLAAALQALLAFALARLYRGLTGKSMGLEVQSDQFDAQFGEAPDPEASKPPRTHAVIPFGPFLGLSAIEALLFGAPLTQGLFALFTGESGLI